VGGKHGRRRRRKVDGRQFLGKVGIDAGDVVLADKQMQKGPIAHDHSC